MSLVWKQVTTFSPILPGKIQAACLLNSQLWVLPPAGSPTNEPADVSQFRVVLLYSEQKCNIMGKKLQKIYV